MSTFMLIQTVLLLMLLGTVIIVIELKDLLYSVILLAGASVTRAIIFYMLQAPDVAITEASINAGIATLLYIFAISRTEREEKHED